jgi:hypothetical protein
MMATNNQTTTAPPLYDFSDKGSLIGMLKFAFRKNQMSTDDMLPAVVVSYDRVSNTVTVQPQIKLLTTDNKLISREQFVAIPVFAYGGGGFVINFPVKQGDRGWIKANDRDISLYTQNMLESGPNTFRLHSFEDGMFFPDVLTGFDIASEDAENMVIQSLDGTTKIAVGTGVINAVIPGASIRMSGTAIAIQSTTLTHNGVPIGSTHIHDLVQPGSGNSGPPI